MRERIIGVDCDDVVINLVPNWIKRYNKDWNDNLEVSEITDWKIHAFVKPECGQKIYDYIHFENDFNIYNYCKPINNALDGVNHLRSLGYRIIFVTASNRKDCKYNWLEKYGFLDDRKNFVHAFDKTLIKMDILIDDNWNNLQGLTPNIETILMNKPWNKKYESGFDFRVDSWNDIMKKFGGK